MKSIAAVAERPARILIVDDERHNRQLLEVMLAPEGYVLLTATNGEDALDMVENDPPDLILLDIMMPAMDGYQVAGRIKRNPGTKNIPIIILTMMDDQNAKLLGLNAGAEDFLTKPVDRAELCARVRNLLRLKEYGDYHDKYSQLLEAEVGSRSAKLIESESLYRSTFDAAPVGIVHMSLDGKWLRANLRLCDLLGYSREELQVTAAYLLVQTDEVPGEREAWRQMIDGSLDRYLMDEKQYRRRDGSIMWARVNMSVHRNAMGAAQMFVVLIEDITERRALEAQIRQASKMDAVGRLASGVAHDFNNLLSVVLSYSEMLAEDLEEGHPVRVGLDEIRAAGVRGVDLTRQLLTFSRQQVLKPKVVDLFGIVSGVESMLRRLIGEDVELTANGHPALGKILVDPGQMEQLIVNLAVNARDAMPNGGRLIIETADVVLNEKEVSELTGVKSGPCVMLTVSDTGVGMDKTTQARMFEPFFTTKEPGKGTGLGLATVFEVVRQSGGAMLVESEPNKGTTFKIYLPTVDRSMRVSDAPAPPDLQTLRGSETILVVEDDDSVRTLARTILRRYGYNVLEAHGGGDALLVCEQHTATIHLVLTDLVMPRMSGRQLAERLLVLRPDMMALYMSGYTDDAIVRLGLLDSAIGFIQKPITPEPLTRKVREALDGVRNTPSDTSSQMASVR
jgi:two-component system cell cycle sensor histidine kinase/response regulator CckA